MDDRFRYIWRIPPIDFWENAIVAGEKDHDRVMASMPEEARYNAVFKTYLPADTEMVPVFLCKADNNGTTYLFADEDVFRFYDTNLEKVKG